MTFADPNRAGPLLVLGEKTVDVEFLVLDVAGRRRRAFQLRATVSGLTLCVVVITRTGQRVTLNGWEWDGSPTIARIVESGRVSALRFEENPARRKQWDRPRHGPRVLRGGSGSEAIGLP
jgi:hypothetical protein